ncbi:MAG: TIGR03643 family protein [Sulfurimonas sp.]|jgi:deoxyribodipyrimidine photolyase-related protein|nr:TIGR03643 family protein [Sulfurimonas sp.]
MIFILFPHHLFRDIQLLQGKRVLLVEESLFFGQYPFHIQKIILHRASMKAYETYLKEQGVDVAYIEDESYLTLCAGEDVEFYDPVDFDLEKKLREHLSGFSIHPNPNFLNVKEGAKLLHHFYIQRRKELDLFIDAEQKPLGGKWSLDAQNRKKIPKGLKTPAPLCFENSYIQEAKQYAKKFDTIGSCETFYYPSTFDEARMLLHYFLEQKFALFGDYQDAIVQKESFLFHANISSALNIGLLDLREIIEIVRDFEGVPFNAKEGFLRQIIGWREFMLRIYKDKSVALRNSNFFGFYNKMPKRVLEAKTGLTPLDVTIQKVLDTSYAHHIERLMVLGNIFVLLEIDPNEVHSYFMSHFIDAYDWVMVGNVYGMSGFSDGGSFTTKPYIASSNYILKMSDYARGEWCEILDALYWSFLARHGEKFANNPRMKMQLALLEKMDESKLAQHKKVAQEFKKELGMYSFSEEDTSRLIEMAWQDRTPFDSIEKLYGLSENQVIKMMRKLMSKSSFVMWRKRMSGRKTKHRQKLSHKPTRFKGPW